MMTSFDAMSTLEALARNDYLRHWIGILALAVTLNWAIQKFLKWKRRVNELDRWIRTARKERDSKVHPVLTLHKSTLQEEANYPLYSAHETRQLILEGKLNVADNVAMLAKRCRKFGRDELRANAITEEFYAEAYKTATAMSETLPEGQGEAPPLFGVPICIKDCMNVKGACTAGGMACRLYKKDEADCLTVELLRDAGAIPLCRGNVMQVMMLAESVNRIWGRTSNPWNLRRSPGGSSGGDAALVAMGCVPLSACADGAGSIRIPASYCGVVGFKPTSTRLSFKGCMRPRVNDRQGVGITVPAVMGSMARKVEDCAMFMKACCVPKLFQKDINIPPIPFDTQQYESTKRLKIGYFETDDYFEPCPTVRRALRDTLQKLREAGHEVVPFQPPTDGWLAKRVFVGIMSAEGQMRSFLEAVEGEPMVSEYNTVLHTRFIPQSAKYLLGATLGARVRHLFENSKQRSVYELWGLVADLLEMRTKWASAVGEAGLDAIIHPAIPIPAVTHGKSAEIACISYMLIGPMLLWPTGVLPVTTVREDEQHYYEDCPEQLPRNQRDHIARLTAQEMKGSAGLPVNLSVLTPAYKDETCLRVMKEIETLVNFTARASAYKAGL